MSRLKVPLCLLLLLTIPTVLLCLRGELPLNRQSLIESKYDGWSGVLRLWYCAGRPAGGSVLSAWLNPCISAFERAHPGVYIQPESVEPATLQGWSDGTMDPPDILLFPPGLLETPAGLTPLEPSGQIREDLARRGDWAGVCFALPVAMGGYAWLEAVPGGEGVVPDPEPFRLWDVAFAALEAVRSASEPEGDAETVPAQPDLDLGLPAAAQPGAWRRFANGEVGALLASQVEIARLASLAEAGRGPDWSIAAVSPFTDQLLFAAVPLCPEPERQAQSEAFAASLLSEGCQNGLRRAGLFSTTQAASGYGSADAPGRMDALLRGRALLAPRAFGLAWIESAAALAGEQDAPDPDTFMERLRAALA